MRELILLALFLRIFIVAASGTAQEIKFTEEPKHLVALEGEHVELRCAAAVVPPQPLNFMWKKNGAYLDISKTPGIEVTPSGSLVFKSLKYADFGSYRCVAQCADGALISQPAKLEKSVLSIVITQSPVHVKEGGFHLFDPQLKTNSPVSVSWQLCSRSTVSCKVPDPGSTYITSTGSLLISPVKTTDNTFFAKFKMTGKYADSREASFGAMTIVEYLPQHWKQRCPEASVQFLPTKTNFTVAAGVDVSMDCLAVLKRCDNTLVLHWKDKSGRRRSETRRLKLTGVSKQDEGTYTCVADVYGYPSADFYLKVIEKPSVITAPPQSHTLGSDGVVPSGVVQNVDTIEWYTNAEKLHRKATVYEIRRDNALVIKQHSPALAGIYQVVYSSQAGSVIRTVRVDISHGACGERMKSEEGQISFLYPKNLLLRSVQCFWLIQTSTPASINFYFTNFILNASCNATFMSISQGTADIASSNGLNFCSTSPPKGLITIAGPYITVYIQGSKADLEKGGFKLLYGANVTVPTTTTAAPKTTTLQVTSTSKHTTATTTKVSTRKHTTATTTKASTRKATTATTRAATRVLSSTTQTSSKRVKSDGINTKKPKTKAASTASYSSTVLKRWSTGTRNMTAVSPKKNQRKLGSSDGTGVVVAVCIAVVVLVIFVIAAFTLYRKRRSASPIQMGSLFINKKTCVAVKGLKETSFSQGNGYSQPFPDVVPHCDTQADPRSASLNHNNDEASYAALGEAATVDSQTYTSLQFALAAGSDSPSLPHPYAVIVPDDEQYMPVTRCDSGPDSVRGTNDGSSSLSPVYQELESDNSFGNQKNRLSPGVIENRGACTNAQPPLYERTTQQPLYHELDDSVEKSAPRKISRGDRQKGQEYLQPQATPKPPRVSPKPRARKTISEGYNNRKTDYAASHYIQPNPVNANPSKCFSQSQRYQKPPSGSVVSDSGIYTVVCSGGDDRATPKEITSPKYQPITSDDAAYLTIMNEH